MEDVEILSQLRKMGTTTISDALDRLGINGQCLGIMPLKRSFQLTGKAFTIRYAPISVEGGSVGDYIDKVNSDTVVVIDNGGRKDVTVWGDLLTLTAHQRNLAGTVIDGVCRDIDRILELDYPIYSRGNWMRTGKDRVMVVEENVPVSIGGVLVSPGDYLRGDGDGVVAIPASKVENVLEAAWMIHTAEDNIRASVLKGETLKASREKNSYHKLQTRVKS
ncbi:RraA family protein [Bacillus sp. 1P10SD]|uniref:RraA family protein n=1 Tax=Bacillus sp. 1P10SD TaxID=3132265 RepID=UPI0039A5C953